MEANARRYHRRSTITNPKVQQEQPAATDYSPSSPKPNTPLRGLQGTALQQAWKARRAALLAGKDLEELLGGSPNGADAEQADQASHSAPASTEYTTTEEESELQEHYSVTSPHRPPLSPFPAFPEVQLPRTAAEGGDDPQASRASREPDSTLSATRLGAVNEALFAEIHGTAPTGASPVGRAPRQLRHPLAGGASGGPEPASGRQQQAPRAGAAVPLLAAPLEASFVATDTPRAMVITPERGGGGGAPWNHATSGTSQQPPRRAATPSSTPSATERALALVVQEKVQELSAELAAQRAGTADLAAQREAMGRERAAIAQERTGLDVWVASQRAEVAAYVDGERAKVQREVRVALRQAKAEAAASAAPADRALRAECEELRATVARLRADLSATSAQFRDAVERHRLEREAWRSGLMGGGGNGAGIGYGAPRPPHSSDHPFQQQQQGEEMNGRPHERDAASAASAAVVALQAQVEELLARSLPSATRAEAARSGGGGSSAAVAPRREVVAGGGGRRGIGEAVAMGRETASAPVSSLAQRSVSFSETVDVLGGEGAAGGTAADAAGSILGSYSHGASHATAAGPEAPEQQQQEEDRRGVRGLSPELQAHVLTCFRPSQLGCGVLDEVAAGGSTAPHQVTEAVSSSGAHVVRSFSDGTKLVAYRNGTERETRPDGTVIVRFINGDIRRTIPAVAAASAVASAGAVQLGPCETYFYAASCTMQSTYGTAGIDVFEFPSGQVELWRRPLASGGGGLEAAAEAVTQEILFPDGTTRVVEKL